MSRSMRWGTAHFTLLRMRSPFSRTHSITSPLPMRFAWAMARGSETVRRPVVCCWTRTWFDIVHGIYDTKYYINTPTQGVSESTVLGLCPGGVAGGRPVVVWTNFDPALIHQYTGWSRNRLTIIPTPTIVRIMSRTIIASEELVTSTEL